MKNHPLKIYLFERQMRLTDFAAKNGLCRQTLHSYLRGTHHPSFKMVKKLIDATCDNISGSDMILWHWEKFISSQDKD